MKWLSILFLLVCHSKLFSQNYKRDSANISRIFYHALVNGKAYENLHSLCKDVGHRLSGSKNADSAVNWAYNTIIDMRVADTIYKIPVIVPRWERGKWDKATIFNDDTPLDISALGGSVGTNGSIKAEVLVVNGIDDLRSRKNSEVNGKIVLFNKGFDPAIINPSEAYSACVGQRYSGAVEAAEKGAIGVMVRSMTGLNDDNPHTGSMAYKDGVPKIPAIAISTVDADMLVERLQDNSKLKIMIRLGCRQLPDKQSYNVVAEIRGSKYPEKIITIGGHLDSWDIGEGAHDDGAGVVHSMELLRIFRNCGISPNYTIRIVLFMNEENGAKGALTYAEWVKEKKETHIMALESDAGGHAPRGFFISSNNEQLANIQQFKKLLEPYGCHMFKQSTWGGGVDINPLKLNKELSINPNMILMGFLPETQRYFDYHHSVNDVFENVHQRELELGCGSIAAMVYLIDLYF